MPLFDALVNEYKGTMLPPDSGLEQKIRELGVSAKQAAKARQAFQRSAELAGFFKMGKDRLVQPAIARPRETGESERFQIRRKVVGSLAHRASCAAPRALADTSSRRSRVVTREDPGVRAGRANAARPAER